MNDLQRKTLPIAQIKPSPYNPRRIDAAAIAGLTKSIDRFGLVQEMVVNERADGSLALVSGHQRLTSNTTSRTSLICTRP